MRRIILLALLALLMTAMLALLGAGTAAAHPHEVSNPSHDQVIANGQNHPGFVSGTSARELMSLRTAVRQATGWRRPITDPMREPLEMPTGATRRRPHRRTTTLLSTNRVQHGGAIPTVGPRRYPYGPSSSPYSRSAWNRYSAHFASRIVHKPSAKGARMVPAGLHAAC